MGDRGHKQTVSARVEQPIYDEIETYRQANDCTKSDAVLHFLRRGIQADADEPDDGARELGALHGHMLGIAAHTTVVAIIVLMVGPGLGLVPRRIGVVVAAALLGLAWWMFVAVRLRLAQRVTDFLFRRADTDDPSDGDPHSGGA